MTLADSWASYMFTVCIVANMMPPPSHTHTHTHAYLLHRAPSETEMDYSSSPTILAPTGPNTVQGEFVSHLTCLKNVIG